MEKRSRLGRGLSSLLASTNGQADPSASVEDILTDVNSEMVDAQVISRHDAVPSKRFIYINLDQIIPNAYQPRRDFHNDSLKVLADSINLAGVIQPIIVIEKGDRYELIAGERRWRAAQLAGARTIPAIVRQADAAQQAQLALIENIHREDLNPIDKAMAFQAMIARLDFTHQQLAAHLGEERSNISNHIRLLDLATAVQDQISKGNITLGHAKLLAGVDELAEQIRLADEIVARHLSVRDLEKVMKEPPVEKKPPTAEASPVPPSAHIADLERRISRDLQMRTEVRQAKKGGKGRIVIHYGSLDQFDSLMNRLNVKVDD